MKIVCDSCSTKYSISDDKVRGKVFKIRCKKCSHIIVVRGTGDAPAPAEVASDAVWHLVVEGDQVGPLTDVEVRARLARGEITSENYVWKEGFSDWLRLVDVPEFAEAAGGAATIGSELFSDSAQISLSKTGQQEVVADEPGAFFGSGSAGQDAARASTKSSSGRTRVPVAAAAPEEDAFSVPAPAVSRGSEGGDLFGMTPVTHADSGRVRTRSSNGSAGGATAARHDGGRVESLTAQRSENSVLFSLSNLQSLAAPAATRPSTTHTTDGSGLIDIRAMAASTLRGPSASSGQSMFGGDSRIAADELPTFGAFSSAAPVLFPIQSSSGPPKWIYAVIGLVVVLVAVMAAAAFSILRKPMIVEQTVAPAPVAVPVAAPPASAKAVAEGELPPREHREEAGDRPAGEKASGEKTSSKSGGGHHSKGSGKKGGSSSGASGDSKSGGDSTSSAAAPPAEPEKAKPAKGSLDDLLEGALSNRNTKGNRSRGGGDDDGPSRKGGGDSAGGGGPLAKSAVVAGMNGVKGKVSNCFNQYKVPGMAMVNVVISKGGKVSSATVTGKFAGTPTGSCVESAVKSAAFPPSDGLSTPYPFNLR